VSDGVRGRWILVVVLAVAAPAWAQVRATSADLTGVALDSTRAVLPDTTIIATNAGTGLTRTAITDRNGRFAIPALPPALYVVTAERAGFAVQVIEGVELALGEQVDLPITLTLAATQARVTVRAELQLVDPQRRALATVVSARQLEALPTNGRNFIAFSLLTPGVSTDRTPTQGAAASSGLTFAGQPARFNNISVDGLDNNDLSGGAVRDTFSQEAVQEFQVLANAYSAEFGKAAGGVVNIVTRSGSNARAGNVFLFGRHDSLNARQHFERFTPAGSAMSSEKAPYRQFQWGATIGGPVKENRTFYFASFERLDVQTANLVTIDQATAALLRLRGFAVDTGNVPYVRTGNQFLAKLDHEVVSGQTLTLRVNVGTRYDENIEPWGGLVARSSGALLESDDATIAGSHTHVVSSTLLNEVRVQYAYRNQQVLSLDPACGGRCEGTDQGGPQVEILGVATAGRQRFTPQPRKNHRFQIVETLSRFTEAHQLKAGIDFSYVDFAEQSLPLLFGGRYIFAPLPAVPGLLPAPISATQAFALGLPAAYLQGYGNGSKPFTYRDVSVFAQDDWRLRSNVTLSAGVRYQRQFLPAFTSQVPGLGAVSFPSDGNNIAPRLAASWMPRGSTATVVHGAYGLYYGNQLASLPGVTGLVNGQADGVRLLVQPFPASIASWQAPGRRVPEPASSYPTLVISVAPELPTPMTHQAVVGVDRALPGRMSVSANLVYARGFNFVEELDYNPLIPELGAGRRPLDAINPATGQPIPGSSTTVYQWTPFGQTWYKALAVTVSRRASGGHQVAVSYTLSQAEDLIRDHNDSAPQNMGRGRNPSDPAGLPLGFDPLSEKGPSLQDQRHRLVIAGAYEAPAGVQLASIVTVGSGRPYNILAGADLNRDGDGGVISPDRARRNPADQATSLGRNAGLMPSQATVDLRVSRRFATNTRTSVELMFEVFNLFNRTNFTEINNVFGVGAYPQAPQPGFSQFTQAGPPRQIQLAAKLRF
jgi:hypothetical protein